MLHATWEKPVGRCVRGVKHYPQPFGPKTKLIWDRLPVNQSLMPSSFSLSSTFRVSGSMLKPRTVIQPDPGINWRFLWKTAAVQWESAPIDFIFGQRFSFKENGSSSDSLDSTQPQEP